MYVTAGAAVCKLFIIKLLNVRESFRFENENKYEYEFCPQESMRNLLIPEAIRKVVVIRPNVARVARSMVSANQR